MSYQKYQIKDLLKRHKKVVNIEDDITYKRITIRINHNGVLLRDSLKGIEIGTKKQFKVNADQFILSKIDARQGAFGIVPIDADGAIITGNFWCYNINEKIVFPKWFLLFTKTNDFINLCKESSSGNTHRKYLKEDIFLNHSLKLPSVEDQKKIVKKLDLFDQFDLEVKKQQLEINKIRYELFRQSFE